MVLFEAARFRNKDKLVWLESLENGNLGPFQEPDFQLRFVRIANPLALHLCTQGDVTLVQDRE